MTPAPDPASAEAGRPLRRPPVAPEWESWDDERLLDVRMCDLGVRIRGSFVEPFLRQVRREMRQRGLRLRPHFWLSDEWFCPDGVTGIAIPFYLAHPRLARLEQAQMLEVEGGDARLVPADPAPRGRPRHRERVRPRDAGRSASSSSAGAPRSPTPRTTPRAVQPELRRPPRRLATRRAIPTRTSPRPSRCGSPPTPTGRERYVGWPALRKLEYVDGLMREVAGQEPRVRDRREVEPLALPAQDAARALRASGAALRRRPARASTTATCAGSSPTRRSTPGAPTAARFLSRLRKEARRRVARAGRGATSTRSTRCSKR